jgi:hypothetical protein
MLDYISRAQMLRFRDRAKLNLNVLLIHFRILLLCDMSKQLSSVPQNNAETIYRIHTGINKKEILEWFTIMQTKYAAVYTAYNNAGETNIISIEYIIYHVKRSRNLHTSSPQIKVHDNETTISLRFVAFDIFANINIEFYAKFIIAAPKLSQLFYMAVTGAECESHNIEHVIMQWLRYFDANYNMKMMCNTILASALMPFTIIFMCVLAMLSDLRDYDLVRFMLSILMIFMFYCTIETTCQYSRLCKHRLTAPDM